MKHQCMRHIFHLNCKTVICKLHLFSSSKSSNILLCHFKNQEWLKLKIRIQMLQAIANVKESLNCKMTNEFHWKTYAVANICKKAIIQKLFIDHGRENQIQRHTHQHKRMRQKQKQVWLSFEHKILRKIQYIYNSLYIDS
jgi:hypothetical protein